MASERRITIAAFRSYCEGEIETVIRQMKCEGGVLKDCVAELNILANLVQSRAESLSDAWPTLLKDTAGERWEQRQNDDGITGVPLGDVQSSKRARKQSQMSTDHRRRISASIARLEWWKQLADMASNSIRINEKSVRRAKQTDNGAGSKRLGSSYIVFVSVEGRARRRCHQGRVLLPETVDLNVVEPSEG